MTHAHTAESLSHPKTSGVRVDSLGRDDPADDLHPWPPHSRRCLTKVADRLRTPSLLVPVESERPESNTMAEKDRIPTEKDLRARDGPVEEVQGVTMREGEVVELEAG